MKNFVQYKIQFNWKINFIIKFFKNTGSFFNKISYIKADFLTECSSDFSVARLTLQGFSASARILLNRWFYMLHPKLLISTSAQISDEHNFPSSERSSKSRSRKAEKANKSIIEWRSKSLESCLPRNWKWRPRKCFGNKPGQVCAIYCTCSIRSQSKVAFPGTGWKEMDTPHSMRKKIEYKWRSDDITKK